MGVAKRKKRGQPKKTPKATKSTEVTPQKSDISMVEGEKEQTTPTTTTAASADTTVVQDDCPDVNECSSPIPPSDMTISKVGQASAADKEITTLGAASNARLQIGLQISTPTQGRKPTAKPRQRQAVSHSLLRKSHR